MLGAAKGRAPVRDWEALDLIDGDIPPQRLRGDLGSSQKRLGEMGGKRRLGVCVGGRAGVWMLVAFAVVLQA